MSYNIGSNGYRDWFADADINALISIFGAEKMTVDILHTIKILMNMIFTESTKIITQLKLK